MKNAIMLPSKDVQNGRKCGNRLFFLVLLHTVVLEQINSRLLRLELFVSEGIISVSILPKQQPTSTVSLPVATVGLVSRFGPAGEALG